MLVLSAVVLALGGPALAGETCERGHTGALRICQEQCNAGDQEACTTLGAMFFQGTDGAPADPNRAAALWSKGCRLADLGACAWLGYAQLSGRGRPKNVPAARRGLEETCDAGYAQACVWLGSLHLGVYGSAAPNPRKAKALFEQTCTPSDRTGCVALGRMYELGAEGVVSPNPRRALSEYMKACQGPNVAGCPHAGRLHLAGKGTTKDPETALRLFQLGCGKEDARSCTELGKAYREGAAGLTQDLDRARGFFADGCSAHDQHSCVQLGWLHFRGLAGLPKDEQGAFALFNRACEAGAPEGCTGAGFLLGRGHTAEEAANDRVRKIGKDGGQARHFLERACGAGASRACGLLQQWASWTEDAPSAPPR